MVWEGERLIVKSVETEWREPDCRHFTVRTEDDRLLELCYYISTERWLVDEVIPGGRKGGE